MFLEASDRLGVTITSSRRTEPGNVSGASTITDNIQAPSALAKLKRNHTGPGVARDASRSGGTHVILHETGSWSDLADPTGTMPAEAKVGDGKGKPSGMLGFLSRRRGRGPSPKPQERGVLGKEGARHVIS